MIEGHAGFHSSTVSRSKSGPEEQLATTQRWRGVDKTIYFSISSTSHVPIGGNGGDSIGIRAATPVESPASKFCLLLTCKLGRNAQENRLTSKPGSIASVHYSKTKPWLELSDNIGTIHLIRGCEMIKVFLAIVLSGVAATDLSARLLKTDDRMHPHVEIITLALRVLIIFPLFLIFFAICFGSW